MAQDYNVPDTRSVTGWMITLSDGSNEAVRQESLKSAITLARSLHANTIAENWRPLTTEEVKQYFK